MTDRKNTPATGIGHHIRLLTALLMITAGAFAGAQTYSTAEELMAEVGARPQPATTQASMAMTITTASGQTLSRELDMWASGTERRLMKFTAPADIAGSGFLQIDEPGNRETLVYLPALGRARRIAGGQQGDSFFGSDFAYEDISGITPEDYTHTLLEIQPGPVYVVEAVPLPETASVYEKLVLEIPEDLLVPRRIEYWRDGALVKVLTVTEIAEIGDYLFPAERRMETIKDGNPAGNTVISQKDVTLDADVPADLFTERFLVR